VQQSCNYDPSLADFNGIIVSAILRASGRDFDVDAFATHCRWKIAKIFRRGEERTSAKDLAARTRAESGLNVVVSDADFNALDKQIKDAVQFLTGNADEIRRLVEFPGVDGVVLDFGTAQRDAIAKSHFLPADLVQAAGAVGIALEVSKYTIDQTGSETT
jgi:hypothetical protein